MNRMIFDWVPLTSATDLVRTAFDYNPSGTLAQVWDGNNHYTTFQYDESDRKIQITYQNGQTQKWSYDDAGNLDTQRYAAHLLEPQTR